MMEQFNDCGWMPMVPMMGFGMLFMALFLVALIVGGVLVVNWLIGPRPEENRGCHAGPLEHGCSRPYRMRRRTPLTKSLSSSPVLKRYVEYRRSVLLPVWWFTMKKLCARQ